MTQQYYEGVLEQGGVLAIDPAYFAIEGGLERALYRIARKHVGQQEEFRIGLETLYAKTGSDAGVREFRRMMKRIIERDRLPGYSIALSEAGSITFAKRG